MLSPCMLAAGASTFIVKVGPRLASELPKGKALAGFLSDRSFTDGHFIPQKATLCFKCAHFTEYSKQQPSIQAKTPRAFGTSMPTAGLMHSGWAHPEAYTLEEKSQHSL